MALARLSNAASGAGTSITFTGTYATGNLIVMLAINTASATVPTVPSGWTSVTSVSANNIAMVVAWKNAASSSDTSGTWTNATALSYAMYTGHNSTTPFINAGGQTGASSTISYSGIVSFGSANDWVLCFSCLANNAGASSSHPPTSCSLVTDVGTSSYESTIFDSNGTLSSYSFNSKTLGASTFWLTKTMELQAAAVTVYPAPIRTVLQAVNRSNVY